MHAEFQIGNIIRI